MARRRRRHRSPSGRGRHRAAQPVSIVIPCRNEKGNIEAAMQRLPSFPAPVEVIFVEGHSIRRHVGRSAARGGRRMGPAHGVGVSADRQRQVGRRAPRLLEGRVTSCSRSSMPISRCRPRCCRVSTTHIAPAWRTSSTARASSIRWKARRCASSIGSATCSSPRRSATCSTAHLNDSLCGTKLLRRDDYARMVRWRRRLRGRRSVRRFRAAVSRGDPRPRHHRRAGLLSRALVRRDADPPLPARPDAAADDADRTASA